MKYLKISTWIFIKVKFISIIGSSGSGKSTLLRSINLLEIPTGGEILYHGENVLQKGYDLPKYRTHLGMVFQSFNLFENLNVLENLIVAQTTVLKENVLKLKKLPLKTLQKLAWIALFKHDQDNYQVDKNNV